MEKSGSDSRVDLSIIEAIKEVVMIVRHLVNNPDQVYVEIESRGYRVFVSLITAPEDVGQVVGRNAYLISSIRSLIAAIQGKNNIQVYLDYVTEEDNKRKQEGYNSKTA